MRKVVVRFHGIPEYTAHHIEGLDLRLQGQASLAASTLPAEGIYSVMPDDFNGFSPRPVVKEGDSVKAGEPLFVSKDCPELKVVSPVSGKVEGVYYKDMSDAMLRGGPKSSNCYSIYADKNAKVITSEQVASGELCYLLNQKSSQAETVWYQTLGSDDHPVFDATHSPVLLASDGTYYNEGSLVDVIPSPAEQYEAYSLQGTRISRNQRGIHIVRTGAGKTYKVLVK